jgi:hypothetical protein
MTTKYLGDSTTRKLGGTSKMKGGGGNTRKMGQSSQRKLLFLNILRRRKVNGRPSQKNI